MLFFKCQFSQNPQNFRGFWYGNLSKLQMLLSENYTFLAYVWKIIQHECCLSKCLKTYYLLEWSLTVFVTSLNSILWVFLKCQFLKNPQNFWGFSALNIKNQLFWWICRNNCWRIKTFTLKYCLISSKFWMELWVSESESRRLYPAEDLSVGEGVEKFPHGMVLWSPDRNVVYEIFFKGNCKLRYTLTICETGFKQFKKC